MIQILGDYLEKGVSWITKKFSLLDSEWIFLDYCIGCKCHGELFYIRYDGVIYIGFIEELKLNLKKMKNREKCKFNVKIKNENQYIKKDMDIRNFGLFHIFYSIDDERECIYFDCLGGFFISDVNRVVQFFELAIERASSSELPAP